MKLNLKHRFIIAVLLLLAALAVYSCTKIDDSTPSITESKDLTFTVVVMRRDAKVTGPIILGGPIKSDRYNVTMPSDSTVKELESIVFQLTGFAHSEQEKVIYKGQEMDSSKTLEYYNVTDGSRVHVLTEYVI